MKRFIIALAAITLGFARPAEAHVTAFIEHHDVSPLENATPYPVADNIAPLFALNGFLYKPGQVDYLSIDATEGDDLVIFTLIPNYVGAQDFSPSLALIGPGLPATANAVPFQVPAGSGATIYTTPKAREISEEQFGYGALLEGTQNEIMLPATGRYYVAIYDPENKLGHYILSVGTSEDETLIPNVEQYTIPKFGDLNGDDKVDVADVTMLLQSIVMKTTLTARQRFSADVGPTGDSANNISPGDGVVDIGDASRLLLRAVGLNSGGQWPF